jgi:hypothetical protein
MNLEDRLKEWQEDPEEGYNVAIELICEAEERLRALTNFKPTVEETNALPEGIRIYIHDLETRCDPAGDTAALTLLKDQLHQLQISTLMDGIPESEEELSPATRARIQKGIDSIKDGNHRPFDPAELLDDDEKLPGQTITFEKPAGIVVDVILLDQKSPITGYRLLEHGYVDGYKVELDAENNKIVLELDLHQVDAGRVMDQHEYLTWKFP